MELLQIPPADYYVKPPRSKALGRVTFIDDTVSDNAADRQKERQQNKPHGSRTYLPEERQQGLPNEAGKPRETGTPHAIGKPDEAGKRHEADKQYETVKPHGTGKQHETVTPRVTGEPHVAGRTHGTGRQPGTVKQLYVEVRGKGDTADGRVSKKGEGTPRTSEEEEEEEEEVEKEEEEGGRLSEGEEEEDCDGGDKGDATDTDDSSVGGSESSSSSSNLSFSSKTTTAVDGRGKGKKGTGWGGKVAALGSWFGRRSEAKRTDGNQQTKREKGTSGLVKGKQGGHQTNTKRKWTSGPPKKNPSEQDEDNNSVSHHQKRATKRPRRHRHDEPSAKQFLPSAASRSLVASSGKNDTTPGTGSNSNMLSRITLLTQLRGGAVADPLKKYEKTLSVAAEQEARTLLVRRARLRAQASSMLL